ncbi:MAG: CDP-diacylglycerol--glycerol-3-phosphate 3-phosphatidyltransferase [Opitutales bacterium]
MWTPANILTLLRVPLLFVVAALLMADAMWASWLAIVVFAAAVVTDWLDGRLARGSGSVSDFGKVMDSLVDKVLMTGLFAMLLITDILAPWTVYLFLLILTREFLVTGLRILAAGQGVILAAEAGGKLKTAIQMAAAILLLFGNPLGGNWPQWRWESVQLLGLAGHLCFVLATLLTLWSGTVYFLKYGQLLTETRAGGTVGGKAGESGTSGPFMR